MEPFHNRVKKFNPLNVKILFFVRKEKKKKKGYSRCGMSLRGRIMPSLEGGLVAMSLTPGATLG